MSSDVSLEILYRIANAVIQPFPYPHIFVRDVFPGDFYDEMRRHLPPREAFKTLRALGRIDGLYPDSRFVLPLSGEALSGIAEPFQSFWTGVASWMLAGHFGGTMLQKFGEFIEQRFGGNAMSRQYRDEAMLVQDSTTFALEPHTDSQSKVLSFLFYLPADASRSHLGTSIYVPKDLRFTCPGGPRYHYNQFRRAFTMPYVPNALFAFVKTDNSFHGVEPITDADVRRDLLLYDIKVNDPSAPAQPAAPVAAAASPVKFSF